MCPRAIGEEVGVDELAALHRALDAFHHLLQALPVLRGIGQQRLFAAAFPAVPEIDQQQPGVFAGADASHGPCPRPPSGSHRGRSTA